jgi:hypothetical protein
LSEIYWDTAAASPPLNLESVIGLPNEIITYKYVKSRIQWFPNEKDPLTDPSRIARGLYPSGTLAHTLRRRNPTEPDYATTSAWRLPIYPNTPACPLVPARLTTLAKTRAQEDVPRATEARWPPTLPLGHDIAGHFSDKVTYGT